MVQQMFLMIVLVALVGMIQSVEIAYSLNTLKKFTYQNFGQGDNTSHVAIGTFLYNQQNIGAFRMLQTANSANIKLDSAFAGKTKYFKLFGKEQDYQTLLKIQPQIIATQINNNPIIKQNRESIVIIDWKLQKIFDDEDQIQQLKIIGWLQRFLVGIPRIIIKIPADYVCRSIGGIPFVQLLNHTNYLVEMYGGQNQYPTFESVFSELNYNDQSNGYTSNCPKNPSVAQLKKIFQFNKAKFNIQKQLPLNLSSCHQEIQKELLQLKDNQLYDGIIFFDDHPTNLIGQ